MIRTFIRNSKNISRDSFFWNVVSNILYGFQSVIMLMVLTRTVGLEDAGIFTLAYANASLFLLIGKYGVRNYQASDVDARHSFQDYRAARIISTSAMVICTVLYIRYDIAVNHHIRKKSIAVLLTCILKVPDALEDVYFGEYQRRGRLDVAAKTMSVRLGCTIVMFCGMLIITQNLVQSLLAAVISSFAVLALLLKWSNCLDDLGRSINWQSVWQIMKECFPLCVGFFFSQYIGNVPKYAIDAHMSDEMQACYGFISMPVFMASLLSNMIYSPIVRQMADDWADKKIKRFMKRLGLQVLAVFVITAVCIAGAYVMGVPVLSALYAVDLSFYKNELLVLLLGGGFLALAGLLNITVTIMRLQYYLLGGYMFVSFLALLFSDQIVMKWGMPGAAWMYVALMGILSGIFILILGIGFFRFIGVKRYGDEQ